MYSTHTTVVCRLIKSTILVLFLFNVKCSQIFHLHFYVLHMYFRFRKSVRIAKIHLQYSGVWKNINIKFKSKYPVHTIKVSSEKCAQKQSCKYQQSLLLIGNINFNVLRKLTYSALLNIYGNTK